MQNTKQEQAQQYAPPFSLRLTFEERHKLDKASGNKPLGRYIREQLFDAPSPRKRASRQPVQNEKILAKLLTEFGKSRLSSNLNQLAKASNSGTLPVSPEIEQELHKACEDVELMRQYLVQALGLKIS